MTVLIFTLWFWVFLPLTGKEPNTVTSLTLIFYITQTIFRHFFTKVINCGSVPITLRVNVPSISTING